MTEEIELKLKVEIQHIFDSGANEVRIFEMVKSFTSKYFYDEDDMRSVAENYDPTFETFDKWLKGYNAPI